MFILNSHGHLSLSKSMEKKQVVRFIRIGFNLVSYNIEHLHFDLFNLMHLFRLLKSSAHGKCLSLPNGLHDINQYFLLDVISCGLPDRVVYSSLEPVVIHIRKAINR